MAPHESITGRVAGISRFLALQRSTVGVLAMVVLVGVVLFYGRSARGSTSLRHLFSGSSAQSGLQFSAVICGSDPRGGGSEGRC